MARCRSHSLLLSDYGGRGEGGGGGGGEGGEGEGKHGEEEWVEELHDLCGLRLLLEGLLSQVI